MFERFTERARQVVVLAQEEARTANCGYVGVEHILLALLREEEGLAARVLNSLDVTVEKVRASAERRYTGSGDEPRADGKLLPFTPRAKKVLEMSSARGAVPRPQLHRHRAHPARASSAMNDNIALGNPTR
jgi:ATP-dependent Clp protease ATP-binding subunit ClpC